MKNIPENPDHNFLHQLFPKDLFKYFFIEKYEILRDDKTHEEYYLIDFEEKNELPDGFSSEEYESKGFTESKRIQDFPLRGKAVYLRIKTRRWRHRTTKTIIKRDFSIIAEGSKFTKDLSDFLKDTRQHKE